MPAMHRIQGIPTRTGSSGKIDVAIAAGQGCRRFAGIGPHA
jgi:hypothetical protein